MKTLLTTALLALALTLSVSAGTHKLPEEKPFVSVAIPDAWETSDIENGIQAQSDDDEVYLTVETTDADSMEAMIDEAIEFLGKNGVTVDEKSMNKREGKVGGHDAINISWSGKDKEGDALIALTIVVLGDDQAVLVTYWASPAGAKKHDKEIDKIADSIKKIGS
jgi:hypothetical protein